MCVCVWGGGVGGEGGRSTLTACEIKLMLSFKDIHIQVNGNISLSENVADNGGLQASFQVS